MVVRRAPSNVKRSTGEMSPLFELLVKILSWAPKILLVSVITSMVLYMLHMFGMLSMLSGGVGEAHMEVLSKTLNFATKILLRILNPLALTTSVIISTIMLLLVLSSVFGMGFAVSSFMSLLVASIIMVIFTPFIIPLLEFLSGPLDITIINEEIFSMDWSLISILTMSVRYMLTFVHMILRLITSWIENSWPLIILLMVVANAIGFTAIYVDKKTSVEVVNRIPERELIRCAGLGGGFGIMTGMIIFRHKTNHISLLIWIALATIATTYILVTCLT